MNSIERFIGEYSFLSNFYNTPVFYEGLRYQNSEAAFQAAKCLAAESDIDAYIQNHHLNVDQVDDRLRTSIQEVLTMQLRMPFTRMNGAEAKKSGSCCSLRPDWETCKEQIMLQIIRNKFTDHSLACLLLNTGDAVLIEGNTWNDRTWGMVNGKGKNLLGKILEKVRDELQEEQFYQDLEAIY